MKLLDAHRQQRPSISGRHAGADRIPRPRLLMERIPTEMSSRTTLSLAVVAVLAAALAAGCEGASTSLSPSPANPPTATPLATRPSMDPELEAMLPDRVGQLAIAKSSL